MADHITIVGSYYEVGTKLGKKTESSVKKILNDFKSSELFKKIDEYTNTPEGAQVLKLFKETVLTYCRDYLEELKGVANGAGVDYNDLFLLNCESEFAAIFGDIPDGSHGVQYASFYDGCTNISMTTDENKVYLAHTEDIGPVAKDLGIMLTVEIKGENGSILENWTDYYIPGVISGGKFHFNRYGVMVGANNIYQKGLNKNGIPRRFMCRSLMDIQDPSQAVQILQRKPGISTAYCFHYVQQTGNDVVNTVIEVAGTSNGTMVAVYKPLEYYHHCNMFQHLKLECHPEESSIHRAAIISQYVNRGQTRSKRDLLDAVSNRQDKKFPVYRNGKHPDYLATGATGIFDVSAKTMEVYTNFSEKSQPKHLFNVP